MSHASLHIVVEGKDKDRTYYGKIADSSRTLRTSRYFVTPIKNIKGTGGKSSVLKLFDEMKSRGHLVQKTNSGTKATVFMLDRDAEIALGGSTLHPHVFYTFGYDVESDIFRFSRVHEALSVSLNVDPQTARTISAELASIHYDAASEWRPWIASCCVSQKLGISCEATFGNHPESNSSGPRSDAEMARICTNQEVSSGLDSLNFKLEKEAVLERLDRIFVRGDGGRTVKGKWLPRYIARRLGDFSSTHRFTIPNGFEKQIGGHFLGALDPTKPHIVRQVERLERLVN